MDAADPTIPLLTLLAESLTVLPGTGDPASPPMIIEWPDAGAVAVRLLIIAVLVLLNGFFVAAEFAMVKSRAAHFDVLAERGDLRAKAAAHVLDHLDAYLSACQLGITLASLGLGWAGEPFVAALLAPVLAEMGVTSPATLHLISGVVAFAVITFLHIVVGEMAPKSLGVRKAEAITLWCALPLRWFNALFLPFITVLNGSANLLLRAFGVPPMKESDALEEISLLASEARSSRLIGDHQAQIIAQAARLSHTRADALMIPAVQVTFLSTAQRLSEAIITAHLDPHTRFPICEDGDRDRVLGYVNFKEMIYRTRTNPGDASLRGVIRPIYFARPDQTAAELLRVFAEGHAHMAIVRTDEGRTLGLVTMEDIVEELVGELEDEFDRLPRIQHALSGGLWMVGGGVPAAEVGAKLGVELPDAKGNLSTWLIRRMGRVPKLNDTHVESGLEVNVRRIRRGQVFEAAVRKAPPPKPPGPATPVAAPTAPPTPPPQQQQPHAASPAAPSPAAAE